MDFLLFCSSVIIYLFSLSIPVATSPLITLKKQHLESGWKVFFEKYGSTDSCCWAAVEAVRRRHTFVFMMCKKKKKKRQKKKPSSCSSWSWQCSRWLSCVWKYSANKKQYAVHRDALVWGPYLPDRRSAPPPPAHAKVCWMTPVSHSLSHSLALSHRYTHTQAHKTAFQHRCTCNVLTCTCSFTLRSAPSRNSHWFSDRAAIVIKYYRKKIDTSMCSLKLFILIRQ